MDDDDGNLLSTQSAAQADKNQTGRDADSKKEGSKDLKEFSSSDEGLVFKYAFDQV